MTTDFGVGVEALEFDMADRMRKAREVAGLSMTKLAAQLTVARQTISNYENRHTRPLPSILKQWALATGVTVEWLETGELPQPDGGDGGEEALNLRIKSPQLCR